MEKEEQEKKIDLHFNAWISVEVPFTFMFQEINVLVGGRCVITSISVVLKKYFCFYLIILIFFYVLFIYFYLFLLKLKSF